MTFLSLTQGLRKRLQKDFSFSCPVLMLFFSFNPYKKRVFLLRLEQSLKTGLIKRLVHCYSVLWQQKYGLELCCNQIDEGLYLGHPYGITINPGSVIGKRFHIHKGATIGAENRGSRKGCPVIGDDVWVGINASVVGKVQIGNNVLIASNAFVNCDVPSNSIVFGNPCVIKPNANPTEGYINVGKRSSSNGAS